RRMPRRPGLVDLVGDAKPRPTSARRLTDRWERRGPRQSRGPSGVALEPGRAVLRGCGSLGSGLHCLLAVRDDLGADRLEGLRQVLGVGLLLLERLLGEREVVVDELTRGRNVVRAWDRRQLGDNRTDERGNA